MAREILLRLAQCYHRPACPLCNSRMITFVFIEGEEQMRAGCSVCKRPLTGEEFRKLEEEFWGDDKVRSVLEHTDGRFREERPK